MLATERHHGLNATDGEKGETGTMDRYGPRAPWAQNNAASIKQTAIQGWQPSQKDHGEQGEHQNARHREERTIKHAVHAAGRDRCDDRSRNDRSHTHSRVWLNRSWDRRVHGMPGSLRMYGKNRKKQRSQGKQRDERRHGDGRNEPSCHTLQRHLTYFSARSSRRNYQCLPSQSTPRRAKNPECQFHQSKNMAKWIDRLPPARRAPFGCADTANSTRAHILPTLQKIRHDPRGVMVTENR